MSIFNEDDDPDYEDGVQCADCEEFCDESAITICGDCDRDVCDDCVEDHFCE